MWLIEFEIIKFYQVTSKTSRPTRNIGFCFRCSTRATSSITGPLLQFTRIASWIYKIHYISLSKAIFSKLIVKDKREVFHYLLHHCKPFFVNQMISGFVQDGVKTYLQKASVRIHLFANIVQTWLQKRTIKVLKKEDLTTSASRSTSSIDDALFQ